MNIIKRMVSSCSTITVNSVINPSHKLKSFNTTILNTTFLEDKDPWRIIQNKSFNPPRDLRLIVHGSSKGKIHPIMNYLVQQVHSIRGSSVELEALTEVKSKDSNSSSVWLVPLFLLPGEHVRNDIPKIYKRLKSEGIQTTLLPFIGSWPQWLIILQHLIHLESNTGKPVLLHHPINRSIGSTYLDYLNKRLKIPIIPWTDWQKVEYKSVDKLSPIPYALAPNKKTKGLRTSDSISSLLEIDFFLLGLIKMLVCLP